MRIARKLTSHWISCAIVIALAGSLSVFPVPAVAQGTQGQNAVYNSGGTVVGSSAFIDASTFIGTGNHQFPNICAALNYILNPLNGILPAGGGVIDARGISGTTALTCTASPWAGISNPPSSTILLPATGAVPPNTPTPIIISTPWILPANTHLIGEGDGISSSSFSPGTTIQATSSLSGSMIQFGSSSVCPLVNNVPICTGISVEKLTLDGQAQSINGISNQYAQNNSYVNHVSVYRILGTGLLVSYSGTSSATNSGPYSNLNFDTGGYSGTSSTVCASINGVIGTRGIHGLSCTSGTNDAPAAVLLDSSNNSIEDVRIVGFYDGIRVGANNNAQSNVLLNIIGDTNPTGGGGTTPIIVVHITSLGHTVSDLSIMGVNNALGGPGTGQYTIKDDVTATSLQDASVGIYALGESPSTGVGHSRFTTSPNAAHWTVGTTAPTSPSCNQGSLYSCTNGVSGNGCSNALWVCGPSGWTMIK
jgi:hypothetical protein